MVHKLQNSSLLKNSSLLCPIGGFAASAVNPGLNTLNGIDYAGRRLASEVQINLLHNLVL